MALFLSFVSIWITEVSHAQTSGQEKDEFSAFDDIPTPSIKPQTTSGNPNAPATTTKKNSKETSGEKIERLKKEIRSNPKNIGLIIELAEELTNRKEYEKVTLLLWKYVDKIDRQGLILLAKAHEKQKEPTEMIRALNILLGKDNKDFEAHSLSGNAYVLLKKNKDAVESYKKAIEFNSKYEPAYNGLIAMYENRNPPNLYELRILYQDMIDAFGHFPRYLRKLCEINTMDGISEPAIEACKEAITKESAVADPYVYLGINYKAIGEEDLASKTFKKAAKDFPKSELAQYNYAKHLEGTKNYLEALTYYKAGTEADPLAARSWLGLATSSFEVKKYEVSLIAYKKACQYDKKNAVAFRRATAILRNQKNSQWTGKFESASEACSL